MNEANFLANLNGLITGDGFLREKQIPLTSCIPETAGVAELATNCQMIELDTSNDSISVPVVVPLDYDESKDALAVVLTARLTTGDMSGAANIMLLDFDQVIRVRLGAADVADLSATVVSDAQSIDDEAIADYVFDLSGLSHEAGDAVSVGIDATETGTAVVRVYAAKILYRSDIVAFNSDDRSNVNMAN